MDYTIFFTVLLLCMFGLVMVFSASYYYAQSQFDDGLYYLKRQAIYMALGFVVMLVVSRLDYRVFDRLKVIIMGAAIALLVAVLLFGAERNGGKRWLILAGVSIQPSEIAKFAMIIFMASFMSKKQAVMRDFRYGVLPLMMVFAVVAGLVMLQPNMSMAVIIGILWLGMLFVGGADKKHLLLILVVCVAGFFLLAFAAPYRVKRMTIFLDPWQDASDSGYQLVQSLYALGAGGLFGRGFNASQQKLLYLTYGESDFIFAIIGEELGWIGCVILMLAYLFLIYRGTMVAFKCKDRYGSLLAAGITITLALQVLVNIGVVTSSMPTTGQPLPFVSSGGSNLLIFQAAIGILLSVSRHVDHSISIIGKKKAKAAPDTVETTKELKPQPE
ncbi:MAG: putative lipid II flippase FtsW [Clostridia bacterium]|nr:putative lipid II flippase FtsW [Clostridia bacterium]